MNLRYGVFILLILYVFSQSSLQTQTLLGISPSFTRQEVIDSPNDWNLWKDNSNISKILLHDGNSVLLKNADNLAQCKKEGNKSVSPDIDSVSDISDGKKLNATMWLTHNFTEPSIIDTVDVYPKNMQIKLFNSKFNINSLEQLKDLIEGSIESPVNNYNKTEENITTVDNTNALKLVYTALNPNGLLLKNMTLLMIKDNKSFDITFSALNKTYNSFIPDIKRVINSIQFVNYANTNENKVESYKENTINIPSAKATTNNIANSTINRLDSNRFSHMIFKEIGIMMAPPNNWNKKEIVDSDGDTNLIFTSPFSDLRINRPSYHEITFTMAISIDSLQHAGVTDYRVIYSKQKSNFTNNNDKWHWITDFKEVSADDKERTIDKSNSSDFFDKKYENPPTYVLFSLDLNKVNYPQQYRLLFYITDYFVISHLYCRLVDTTNWVMIPPPQFELSPKSNSLTLRPGENTTTEVTIKSNVDLPTQVYYASNYIENNTNYSSVGDNKKVSGLALNFIPNKISLSPSGVGSSNLKITVPSEYNMENKEQSITIPISANITFPNTITNRGGESFSNSKSQSISANSNLTLTILPRYSPGDILNNFVRYLDNPNKRNVVFFSRCCSSYGSNYYKVLQ